MKTLRVIFVLLVVTLGCTACHGGRFGFRPHGLVTIGSR